MGVLADYGVTFAGYEFVAPDGTDSSVVIDSATPAPGTGVEVTITALSGVNPAPNRGVRVTVTPDDDCTVGAAPRTDADGVSVVLITVGQDAEEVLRTITVSCGGVALDDEPTFTPTAP